MADTFRRHWPPEVPLRVYTEGFRCEVEGVEQIDLDTAAPWLAPWKAERTKEQRGAGAKYNYKTDAVRFSHKVAAIGAAAEDQGLDILIWLDADIVTHAPVTVGWLKELFPEQAAIAWLDRKTKSPETGFLMFRLPMAQSLIGDLVAAYESLWIFRLPETHDSYVVQQIVEAGVIRGEITVASLSGDARAYGHPLVNGRLGECLDHLKGARKETGKSRPRDLIHPRREFYWRW
jgi:hypothetical protein